MNNNNHRKQIYEGKSKILYSGPNPDTIIVFFKDDATAFNNQKRGTFEDKGYLNNLISSFLMEQLKPIVPNHFISRLNEREQLVKRTDIIPLEVVFRQYAAGSFVKRMPYQRGEDVRRDIHPELLKSESTLNRLSPLIEFCCKNDEFGDPLVSEGMITHFDWLTDDEIKLIKTYVLKIVHFLNTIFERYKILLVDGKFEFGKNKYGRIMLADDICPDGLRLWRQHKDGSFESLDKDLFREGLGGETEAYREVAKILNLI